MENKKTEEIMREVRKVIFGKDECIRQVMTAILAGGHILIEDIPGVGKTSMALAFARAMNLTQNRVQFTPDVLPSDIVGFSMFIKEKEAFVYQPGAVMCNLFLADEINRTSAKTQSALLEVMEEGTVTVDGVTRNVLDPFIVIATENPIGSAGTQRLPESQLDRFMICIEMGYPDIQDEVQIIQWSENDYLQFTRELQMKGISVSEQNQKYMEHVWLDFQAEYEKVLGLERNISLKDAIMYAGEDFHGHQHDALVDARNTACLFGIVRDEEKCEKALKHVIEVLKPKTEVSLGDMFDFSGLSLSA